jgi:3-oxoacyl-[acyl-carrier-protein] synthase-3
MRVLNTGVYLPEKVYDNEYFSSIVDTSDEWISTRTGIKTRHIAEEQNYEMATKAAKNALGDVNPLDIDLIMVSTVTADFWFPSTACLVQREIGAKNAVCFDVSAACAGFNHIFEIASNYNFKYALIIGSERLSKVVDYTDRANCILFGDGAGAFLLGQGDGVQASYLGSEGDSAATIFARHRIDEKVYNQMFADNNFLHQDGKEVYKFATKILPLCCQKVCEKIGWGIDEIDWFIPHQANIRIIETGAKNLGVSMDKFIVTIDKYGNTSSSSEPLAFHDGVTSGKIKRGDKICLVGFGSGLVYGANAFVY